MFVAHFDALMTGVGCFHIKQCGFPTQIQMQGACSVLSMVGLNKTKTRNSLALDGKLLSVMTMLYVGVLYPCHQASKCAKKHLQQKKETSWNVYSLCLCHTHTHTHSFTYMLRVTVILLFMCTVCTLSTAVQLALLGQSFFVFLIHLYF